MGKYNYFTSYEDRTIYYGIDTELNEEEKDGKIYRTYSFTIYSTKVGIVEKDENGNVVFSGGGLSLTFGERKFSGDYDNNDATATSNKQSGVVANVSNANNYEVIVEHKEDEIIPEELKTSSSL